jgi:ribonuclease P protein component
MRPIYPRSKCLRRRRDFLRLQKQDHMIQGNYIYIYYSSYTTKETKIGITVSKKFGCAVKRNRIKRIIKEASRRRQHLIPKGLEIVIHPKKKTSQAKSYDIEKDFLDFFYIINNF